MIPKKENSIVYCNEGHFWGCLPKIFANDSDSNASSAEFDFLHSNYGYWEFPIKHDIEIAEAKFVFYGSCTPIETCKSGYKFKEVRDAYILRERELLSRFYISCISL